MELLTIIYYGVIPQRHSAKIWNRKHAGIKLHPKFSDPPTELASLSHINVLEIKFLLSGEANCKNMSKGASGKLQIKCQNGLPMQHAVDMLAPVLWV